ncbi:hypothetical protein OsI_25254 [Oryza sativa Indica Group]|uniref:Uncharacterized protein n=1 Tax=Oryza sativa subsp. indica TaxID=39946 RepID=A2YJ48_ORYSI|nr:hypothetical protein OsI_25254 [Oryza sativa Indica Group]
MQWPLPSLDHRLLDKKAEVPTVLQKLELHQAVATPSDVSSVTGRIIRDLSMMVIPIEHHMVHRGHGIFDFQQGLKISRCSAQPCNCVGRCCNGSTLEHPWCGLKPVRDKAIDDCFRTATPTRIKLGDGGTSFWVDDWFPDSGAVANLVPIVSTSVKPEKWTVASI